MQSMKEAKKYPEEKYYKDKPADFSYLLQNGYKIYKELGRGGYGVVYKAYEYRDNCENKKRKFAIKINFQTVSPELIFSEIAFLTLIKGTQNTPQMVDLFNYEEKTHIVIEYFKYQPFIEFFADFGMEDIKHYIYQMLLGVKTLKSMGIFHRDVKPGNFLFNKKERKGILIDYGLSEIDDRHIERLKEENKIKKDPELQKRIELYMNIKKCEKIVGKNKIGTESFMPLESILRFRDQGYQVDIWPIGVVFLQFLLKKYNIFNNVQLANIFGSEAVIDLCRKYDYEVTLPSELPKHPVNFKDVINKEGFDDIAEDLLKKLIALDQAERITVEEALEHPFFNSIRDFEEKQKEYKQNQLGQNPNGNNLNMNHLTSAITANNNSNKNLQGISNNPNNTLGIPAGAGIMHSYPYAGYQMNLFPIMGGNNPGVGNLNQGNGQNNFGLASGQGIANVGGGQQQQQQQQLQQQSGFQAFNSVKNGNLQMQQQQQQPQK